MLILFDMYYCRQITLTVRGGIRWRMIIFQWGTRTKLMLMMLAWLLLDTVSSYDIFFDDGLIFSWTILSRPNKVSLKCPYACPSAESFFDFNEIWPVRRGRWMICNGMQYDPSQGQGDEPLKVGNPSIFKSYLLRHLQWSWQITTDS